MQPRRQPAGRGEAAFASLQPDEKAYRLAALICRHRPGRRAAKAASNNNALRIRGPGEFASVAAPAIILQRTNQRASRGDEDPQRGAGTGARGLNPQSAG